MEMSLWSENLLLDGDWGLDLPFHQEIGPLDDLKFTGYDGTDLLSFQPQEAEAPASVEAASDEGNLDSEWMESSGLFACLSDLGSSSDPKLVDSSTDELTPMISEQVDLYTTSILEDKSSVLAGSTIEDGLLFDALESPVQLKETKPVSYISIPTEAELNVDDLSILHTSTGSNESVIVNQDFLGGYDFSFVGQSNADSLIYLDGVANKLINSPLSADEVESMLSSEPTSPRSSSADIKVEKNIFESSPELYKVISTSSPEVSSRYSPYQKSKPVKRESKASKRRSPAQPVPESVISSQLNKKDRKKLQNKNAAIRYRQKKKEEAHGIKSEEQELEEYNVQLKSEVEDIEREIRYMKSLMEDIFKAKGLL